MGKRSIKLSKSLEEWQNYYQDRTLKCGWGMASLLVLIVRCLVALVELKEIESEV